MEIPIANGFYNDDSLPISHQECVNWYPKIPQVQGALSPETLRGIPGISGWISKDDYSYESLAIPSNRGSLVMNGIPYFVSGAGLWSVKIVAGAPALNYHPSIDDIGGDGRVSIAGNGEQLMILVPGGDGYIYKVSSNQLFKISDSDFKANGNPQHVVFIDSYFVCTTDSKKWIISSQNDGTAWDALEFGSAESSPDDIVAPVVVNNQIYIIGGETTEGFVNTPEYAFTFQRNNVFIDKGCLAPFSIINSNKTFYMIGAGKNESPAILKFTGNDYVKISTPAIDNILNNYSKEQIEVSFAWAYSQAGANFIGFSFPDTTFVFDESSGKWHERKSHINEIPTRWRVNSIVLAYGLILVADAIDGRIGVLDTNEYKEYGEDIIRVFTTLPLSNLGKKFRLNHVELTVESGVGNSDVPDPQISMSRSDDAKIFGYEKNRSIGKVGKYDQKVVWRRNGYCSRFCVLKFRLSDPVKPVVIKLEVNS